MWVMRKSFLVMPKMTKKWIKQSCIRSVSRFWPHLEARSFTYELDADDVIEELVVVGLDVDGDGFVEEEI
jgi:hypothetical protein